MQFRKVVFQLHWLLGISAGLVLALVGVTGALLSFEDALLAAINRDLVQVQAGNTPLAPSVLVERVAAQRPDATVQAVTLERDPRAAATLRFAPGPGGGRGERTLADPYTGQLLGALHGAGFFRTTMQLHRWLAAGEVGKQVVGASTVALLYFCVSGLYLRWPRRRWRSLRTWLALDWKQKGGAFLWHLHAVAGTWVLLAYLVMGLSGLWWSYGWYREGLQAWAGMAAPPTASQTAPPRRASEPSLGGSGASRDASAAADRGPRRSHDGMDTAAAPASFDPDAAWAWFVAAAPGWGSATLGWPDGQGEVEVRWLAADAQHERAWNTLSFAPDGSVASDVRHEQRPWRQRLVGSIFAVHRGSFFGPLGTWVFMLASLAMPLFAVTGWLLYLRRRRLKRARSSMRAVALASART